MLRISSGPRRTKIGLALGEEPQRLPPLHGESRGAPEGQPTEDKSAGPQCVMMLRDFTRKKQRAQGTKAGYGDRSWFPGPVHPVWLVHSLVADPDRRGWLQLRDPVSTQ